MNRSERLGVIGVASIAMFVVLLMLTSPVASATPPTSFGPPFHARTISSNSTSFVGLGLTQIIPSPHANAHSGKVVTGTYAAASGHLSTASTATTAGFYGPSFKVGTSGNHSVVYKWAVSWMASGGCTSTLISSGETRASAYLIGNLFDNTTGTWVLGTSGFQGTQVSIFHHAASCRHSWTSSGVSKIFSISLTASLVAGDQYFFFTVLNTSSSVRGGNGVLNGLVDADAAIALKSSNQGTFLLSLKVT